MVWTNNCVRRKECSCWSIGGWYGEGNTKKNEGSRKNQRTWRKKKLPESKEKKQKKQNNLYARQKHEKINNGEGEEEIVEMTQ